MPREKPSAKSSPSRNTQSTRKAPVPKRPLRRKGPGKPGAGHKSQAPADDITLVSLVVEALQNQTFLRLVFSQPLKQTDGTVSKLTVRPVKMGDDVKFQKTSRIHSKEFHENLSAKELVDGLLKEFGVKFEDAHLFTTDADFTVRWNDGRAQKVKRRPPSQTSSEVSDHNRQKQYLIPAGVPCPFLIEVGVMLPNGQVRPAMYHKFRQINRYLEFVEDLLPVFPATGPIQIVDFGCGKSYLTFAVHHLLTKIHGREVQLVGLDLKADVIEDCSRIAKNLQCEGLTFQVGRIESFVPTSHVHLAISLHACDTATDDSLAAALRWGCEAILAVPCCQHEICHGLGQHSLPGITEFGILKDRFASLATDALRAQFLELQGYKTQILEFIETEHTPKNLLLRAVRRPENAAEGMTERQAVYDGFKKLLGITDWHLEQVFSTENPPGS